MSAARVFDRSPIWLTAEKPSATIAKLRGALISPSLQDTYGAPVRKEIMLVGRRTSELLSELAVGDPNELVTLGEIVHRLERTAELESSLERAHRIIDQLLAGSTSASNAGAEA